ncbi:MAG: hypothetical protein IPI43_01060 [Sandaracinaceae bacterium]|nr:hypothetical protein [Sandaracinaceae bacterium]
MQGLGQAPERVPERLGLASVELPLEGWPHRDEAPAVHLLHAGSADHQRPARRQESVLGHLDGDADVGLEHHTEAQLRGAQEGAGVRRESSTMGTQLAAPGRSEGALEPDGFGGRARGEPGLGRIERAQHLGIREPRTEHVVREAGGVDLTQRGQAGSHGNLRTSRSQPRQRAGRGTPGHSPTEFVTLTGHDRLLAQQRILGTEQR